MPFVIFEVLRFNVSAENRAKRIENSFIYPGNDRLKDMM